MNNSVAGAALRWEPRMNGWNAPVDFKQYISSHWLKFEEPNPMLHQLLGVLYIFFMIFSVTGNGIVIYFFLNKKSLRTPGNMFIVNLAICDFIMMLKTPIFIVQSFNLGPIWGVTGCQIFAWMGSLTGPGAAVTNAAIAWDRYKTIGEPFGKRLSRGQAFLAVIGLWIYVLPNVIMPGLEIWGRFVPEGYLTSCTFDYITDTRETRLFVLWIWFWSWVVPLAVIVFCYYRIFAQVRTHENALQAQAKKMNVQSLRSGDAANMRQEVRVAKVGVTLTSLFLFSWTPYAVVAFIAAFGDRNAITAFVSMIPALTCKTAACIDPYVYAINHPKFRLELQEAMPWFCIHEVEDKESAKDANSITSDVSTPA